MTVPNRKPAWHWRNYFRQPLDRLTIGLIAGLSVVTLLLLSLGNHAAPRVRDFSWQNRSIDATDTTFTITFSRPMNQTTVEQGLTITPPLPGKVSWAGNRLAYTLTQPIEYGQEFELKLPSGQERFNANSKLQPFSQKFSSRDRAFAVIGAVGDDRERLMLVNMSHKDQSRTLTPSNLKVLDFYPYPDRERIAFAAIDRTLTDTPSPTEQQIYSVTTGLGREPAGKVELLLDNKNYQNLKFTLAENGQLLVVQRISRTNPNEFDPWVVRPGKPPEVLKTQQPGGDFVITPDSSAIAIAQGQGLAILPLESGAEPLGFLPKFGNVLSFARDGSMATMVKYNTDFTRSLFLVTSQGAQKDILKIKGSIRSTVFDPTRQLLYCLLTELQPGATYSEQPYLAVMHLKTALEGDPTQALKVLAKLPPQQAIQISLAPDGRAILFDQTRNDPNVPMPAGTDLSSSRIWILPTETLLAQDWQTKVPPLELMPGFQPRWLP
jgi:hypothetical protein